jgi:hypothetical protein
LFIFKKIKANSVNVCSVTANRLKLILVWTIECKWAPGNNNSVFIACILLIFNHRNALFEIWNEALIIFYWKIYASSVNVCSIIGNRLECILVWTIKSKWAPGNNNSVFFACTLLIFNLRNALCEILNEAVIVLY